MSASFARRALVHPLLLLLLLPLCQAQADREITATSWLKDSPFNVFVLFIVICVWFALCCAFFTMTGCFKWVQQTFEGTNRLADSEANDDDVESVEGGEPPRPKLEKQVSATEVRVNKRHEEAKRQREAAAIIKLDIADSKAKRQAEREAADAKARDERRITAEKAADEKRAADAKRATAEKERLAESASRLKDAASPEKKERRGTAHAFEVLERAKHNPAHKSRTDAEIGANEREEEMVQEMLRRKMIARVQQKQTETKAEQVVSSVPPSTQPSAPFLPRLNLGFFGRANKEEKVEHSPRQLSDTSDPESLATPAGHETPPIEPQSQAADTKTSSMAKPAESAVPLHSPRNVSEKARNAGKRPKEHSSPATAGMTLAKLDELKSKGFIDDLEYERLKANIRV